MTSGSLWAWADMEGRFFFLIKCETLIYIMMVWRIENSYLRQIRIWELKQREKTLMSVLVSFNLNHPGRKFKWGGGYLHWVDLWSRLWGLVLMKLIKVGIPSPLWSAPYPRQQILNCVRVEKSSWVQAREHSSLVLCILDCGCGVSVSIISCWDLPESSYKLTLQSFS